MQDISDSNPSNSNGQHDWSEISYPVPQIASTRQVSSGKTRKTKKYSAIFRKQRRPLKYLRSSRRIGTMESMIGTNQGSVRKSRRIFSSSKRRLQHSNHLESIDLEFEENEDDSNEVETKSVVLDDIQSTSNEINFIENSIISEITDEDVASMLQIDSATASTLTKTGDVVSPVSKMAFEHFDGAKKDVIETSKIEEANTLNLPTHAITSTLSPQNLTLDVPKMHIINESRKFPMAGPMDIDVTHSRSITANEDDEVAKSPSHLIQQQNGFLSRRLSRVLVTPTNDESKMPRSNKVANINQGLDLTNTKAQLPHIDISEKKSFWQKTGFSTIIPNNEERNEFKRKPLKYLREKLILDKNEGYFYYWVSLVSLVYVYNLIVVIARSVFIDLDGRKLWIMWLFLDLISDMIYVMDMFVRSHTGFLEQGLLVRDVKRIKEIYYKSVQFRLDFLSVLPFDYLTLFVFHRPALFRFNRLLRRERLVKFMSQTETRSAFPNTFRVGSVVWYIAIIIHWNACFYFLISEMIGLGSDTWVYGIKNTQSLPEGVIDTLARRYIYSFYWSTLILTTIGEVPGPQANIEFAFVTMDLMCGVLIFATIVGNVGSMISNSNQSRTEFQNRIDSIKQYMELRKVGKQLEARVIKWFDYLWANKQSLSDQQVLSVLPTKLQCEIAMHVHFETLRKVRIFQDCEAGLLAELVLKLQLQVFSPMDYVCRKGDIGREMYIVKRGMLQVVADDGSTVLTTLSEGAVFGELSILNIQGSKNGNRRTANVRSVGYTDLFVLKKTDLWNALREYPEARKILIRKGREILRKDNLLDESVPEETKTAEEIADELQSSVRILQTRLARLMAEHISSDTKMRDRINYLESKLEKYDMGDHSAIEKDNDWVDIQVNEAEIEAERQKLLHSDIAESDSD